MIWEIITKILDFSRCSFQKLEIYVDVGPDKIYWRAFKSDNFFESNRVDSRQRQKR